MVPRRLPLVWLLGAVASGASILGLATPRDAASAPPDGAEEPIDALDAPRWDVRRAAERAIEAAGVAALEAATASEEGQARLSAWSKQVDARLATGGPAAVDALHRVLRRLEVRASDDQVRGEPRLLRVRLERLVPQGVTVRGEVSDERDDEASSPAFAAASSAVAVRGLFPEARPVLIAMIQGADDARTLAGVVSALCGEAGDGPEDDETLAALTEAWGKDPERLEAIAGYVTPDGGSPAPALGLALVLSGRAAALPQLRSHLGVTDDAATLQSWLERRLPARGLGDMTLGTFLVRLGEATTTAATETEAAERALAGGLPWLARLCARRALFLDGTHTAAREVLGKADRALGLLATALHDGAPADAAGSPADAPGTAKDDPAAQALDRSLRAGHLSMRLVAQIELGEAGTQGVVPVAIEGPVLVHGTARGHVALADPETGVPSSEDSTGLTRAPRSLAVSNGVVSAVTGRGGVIFWTIENRALKRAGAAGGPFYRVAAGRDGEFWFAGAHRVVFRSQGATAPARIEKIPAMRGWFVDGMAMLSDGAVLVRGAAGSDPATVVRIDPRTGAEKILAQGDRALLRSAAFGADVLVAEGSAYRWLAPDGTQRGGGEAPEGGRIVGLAGDAATSTVYLTLADGLVAVAAKDGAVRWIEHVEGSDDPVLGGGLVCVTAGSGPADGADSGDNRTDRTLFVLRAGVTGTDPFGTEQRVRTVDVAVAAAEAGHLRVAEALLDPASGWFSSGERWAAKNALREAYAHGLRARGQPQPAATPPGGAPVAPEDEDAPAPGMGAAPEPAGKTDGSPRPDGK